MAAQSNPKDWRDRKVREWLLLLLRFAVTREPSDQAAVLAMADELDSLGMRWRPAAPSFFLRTSNDVCAALLAVTDGHNNPVLQEHAIRIDDPRLRRAFQTAAGLFTPTEVRERKARERKRRTRDLWKGLPDE